MKALKATIMLESCTMVSGLLGQAFKLTLKPPRLAESAPSASPGVPVVLMARAPNTVRVIQECSDRVGVVMEDLAMAMGGEAGRPGQAGKEQEPTGYPAGREEKATVGATKQNTKIINNNQWSTQP
eukprot:953717-Ditylum_brightwellii.AAC.1